uniref:rRNA methyltransferase 2, mitochondrial n=1 Tax=Ditylenchus dipsaci TaxID=166011 RepID=A0A915DFK8_9BILA
MPLPRSRCYHSLLRSSQIYASTSSKCFYSSKGRSAKIISRDSEVIKYLNKQFDDSYSKLARLHDYRARSAFKLLEMNEKLRIVQPGDVVVDVGAAPGSWCQVLSNIIFPTDSQKETKVNPLSNSGYILGIDLQPMVLLENVDLLGQANITKQPTQEEIRRRLSGRKLNAVFSDMAPNPTGDPTTDHYRIVALCRCVLDLMVPNATSELPPTLPLLKNGKFLCKLWDGPTKQEFMDDLKKHFNSVRVVKPAASKDHSAEIYLYSSGFVHSC